MGLVKKSGDWRGVYRRGNLKSVICFTVYRLGGILESVICFAVHLFHSLSSGRNLGISNLLRSSSAICAIAALWRGVYRQGRNQES